MSVPGWPSIDDEVIAEPEPDPYPSNISEFDRAILHFIGACDDAHGQVLRIRDCRKHETQTIAELKRYVRRLQTMITQCQTDITRKQAQDRPEHEIERLQHHIETAEANIASAQAGIEESEEALQICNKGLEDSWQAELSKRKATLSTLRRLRRNGINSRTQQTRLCGAIKGDGSRCHNKKEFVNGQGWRPCYLHRP